MQRFSPGLERRFVVGPRRLIGKSDAKIVPNARGYALDGNVIGERELARDEPRGRITSLGKLCEVERESLALPKQEADFARYLVEFRVGQRAE